MYRTFWFVSARNVGNLKTHNLETLRLKTKNVIWARKTESWDFETWNVGNWNYIFCFGPFEYLIFQISWRWGPGNDEKWSNEISKIMDMNFISMKKPWNGHLVTFVFSSKGIPSTPQHSDSHPCTRPGWSRSLSGWSRSQEMGKNKEGRTNWEDGEEQSGKRRLG